MHPNLRIIQIKIKFKMQKSPPKEDPCLPAGRLLWRKNSKLQFKIKN